MINSKILVATVGGMVGFIGSYTIYIIKLSRSTNNLRVALISEISIIDSALRRWADEIDDENKDNPEFPQHINPIIYKSVVDNIGKLTEKETELLVQYYTSISIIRDMYNRSNKDEVSYKDIYKMVSKIEELNKESSKIMRKNKKSTIERVIESLS